MRNQEIIKIDFILSLLKSNNQKLFNEIILAKKNKMWATVIVFSLAIIDNIFNDDDYYKKTIDGLELNNLKFGKDIAWLRNKRNGILHFDNLKENSKIILTDYYLKINSEKAYRILLKTLIKLFPYYEK